MAPVRSPLPTGTLASWDWLTFRGLPSEDITVDLHCVTKWSKLGTRWRGVSLDTLLADMAGQAEYALVSSHGGYTTNLPMADLLGSRAWIAFSYDGPTSRPSTAAPPGCWSRTCTCGSPRSGCAASNYVHDDTPGFWETTRLPQLRRPMAGTAILGRLTWQVATVAAVRPESATARTLVLDVGNWPGHLAGQHVDVRLTAEDGYSAQRSYSIATGAEPAERPDNAGAEPAERPDNAGAEPAE